ncbi:DNA ligase [Parashewanella tropica]|uniref:DNA ligase n=1 Tax=Parashewanella tropica TaxID=2547970 RepID=UPI001059BF5F|nr:DNA ligase [Parashewanella tropica]
MKPNTKSIIYFVFTQVLLLFFNSFVSAKGLQLASKFKLTAPVSEYLVSEKYDGVRGRWDGTQMWTRAGNLINLPSEFTRNFPKEPLDGELWIARKKFEQISALVRTQKTSASDWKQVRFMVYDVPNHKGTFEERYQYAIANLSNLSPHLVIIEQTSFETEQQLDDALNVMVSHGAEGLMLHKKSSLYKNGRNPDLMKLKLYSDAEAKVVAHIEGKGKFKGMMGAILVEMPNGKRFKIGSGFSNQQRKNPPKIGSIITYKYYGFTQKQTPRFASFLREREPDL